MDDITYSRISKNNYIWNQQLVSIYGCHSQSFGEFYAPFPKMRQIVWETVTNE